MAQQVMQFQSHSTIKALLSKSPAATTNGSSRRQSLQLPLRSSFFSSPSFNLLLVPSLGNQEKAIATSSAPTMRVASKQAYICRDCGYIYNDRTPFDKLPDKYFCPVCGAPKRRFRAYQPAVSKNANAADVRKERKAELQRDEAIGKALPIAVVVGIVALLGLYFYLNTTL